MKRWIFFLCLFVYTATHAQNKSFSNEAFVNAVYKTIADSNAAHYNLSVDATPCSFRKFDYDEWYKYGLQEDIPFYILNELSKKCFLDAASSKWHAEKLTVAVCVDDEKASALLSLPLARHTKNMHDKAGMDKVVFYFSKPAFTDDNQYAVIDMGYRCDDHQCGMGATFIFKQVNGQWKIAGKKLAWGN